MPNDLILPVSRCPAETVISSYRGVEHSMPLYSIHRRCFALLERWILEKKKGGDAFHLPIYPASLASMSQGEKRDEGDFV